MHPADPPTVYGRAFAAASRGLGLCCASGRIRKALGGVYGVVATFYHLLPPTVTCSTNHCRLFHWILLSIEVGSLAGRRCS